MPPTIAAFFLCLAYASTKVYDRCELARELKYIHELPGDHISTWVCIVAHESIYDTAAMNPGSGDHGLFQISQLFWCSPPGDGFGCNAPCAAFRDDNIADDVKCVKRIFKEHTRISGDGFNAWAVYPLYCKGDNSRYVRSCFDNEIDNSVSFGEEDVPVNTSSTEKPFSEEDDEGYEFPPLPSPPRKALENTVDISEDVYKFPPLPTTHRITPEISYTEISSTNEKPTILQHDDEGYKFPSLPTPFEKTLENSVNSSSFIQTTHAKLPETATFTEATTIFSVGITSFTTLSTSSLDPIVPKLRSRLLQEETTSAPFNKHITTLYKVPVATKSTSAYITKKPYSTKATASKSTPLVTLKPKQLTFKPFPNRPNIIVTQRPVLGPPMPPPSPKPLLPRPTIRPLGTRPSTIRPLSNVPSRLTLRPFSRRTTTNSNQNTVFSSTTPLQFTVATKKSPTSTAPEFSTSATKKVYTYFTQAQKPTSTKATIAPFSSTIIQPSSSVPLQKTSSLSTKYKTEGTTSTKTVTSTTSPLKSPVLVSHSSNNGISLKRQERRYYDEFPGYIFSRLGNGFKLIHKT